VDGRSLSKHLGSRLAFSNVAPLGSGSVTIDEANRLRRKAGIRHRQPEGGGHSARRWLGYVISIRVGPVAYQLRVDARPSCARVFVFLEYEGRSALSYHEPIAIAVEGTRGLIRGSISRAGGEKSVEHRSFENAELVGAADHI